MYNNIFNNIFNKVLIFIKKSNMIPLIKDINNLIKKSHLL